MILDIPFIINEFPEYTNQIAQFITQPVYYELSNFSIIINKSFELYKIPIYSNSYINYMDWNDELSFNKLLNGDFDYRPVSNDRNKINSHFIPKIPFGYKLNDMTVPIKSNKITNINNLDISNIEIFNYTIDDDFKLNQEPILYIDEYKWINKKITSIRHFMNFKMEKWGYFTPLNNININFNNNLYIVLDASNFITVNDYINNIDKLSSTYLRLLL
jgi:hypothetical protein